MNNNHTKATIYIAVGTAVTILLAAFYILALTYRPAYSAGATAQRAITLGTAAGGQRTASVQLNIVQSVGLGTHADWLGYQTPDQNNPNPGAILHLPANALVTVTIHNYDSRTALRNTFFTLVQGTVGGAEYVNGHKITVMDPSLTSHTFTISDLGVSVPMEGVGDNAKPTDFTTMRFTFKTPASGTYRWQCIVPCGSGLYGNGGPMSEIGYMSGIISVG